MINACVSNMNILAITDISLLLFGNYIIQVKGMLFSLFYIQKAIQIIQNRLRLPR